MSWTSPQNHYALLVRYRCLQGAAVRDAESVLPLELALRCNAPVAVVQAVLEAYPQVASAIHPISGRAYPLLRD